MLIAGHGRVAAAAKLGLTIPIPVIVAQGGSEEEKQAYRLADNQLTARGSWDPDLLRSELRDPGHLPRAQGTASEKKGRCDLKRSTAMLGFV